jgi:hypothetical protein
MYMNIERLIDEFEDAHPQLMALSPIIIVDEITESFNSENLKTTKYDPPLFQIRVQHSFIFDNRLVPSEFNGLKVINFIVGNFPAEFLEPTEEISLEEYYAPERYIKFVDRNLSLIRKKLKKPNLSKKEALAALMAGFSTMD